MRYHYKHLSGISGAHLAVFVLVFASIGGAILLQSHAAGTGLYYVDSVSGNDNNAGTAASPWQHISKANAMVQAGDTVYLKGTFDQQSIAPVQSGTAGSPITYTAASPGAATLDHSPNGDTGNLVSLIGKNYITLDGIKFDNSDDGNPACPGSVSYWCTPLNNKGIIASNDNHITIKNCDFHHVQVQFINSDDGLITNNTGNDFIASYNNPWPSGTPDKNHPMTAGDMIVLGDGSQRNTISNNVLHNAGHSDIEIGFGHLNEAANDGNLITGNTLDNHWWKDLILYGDGQGAGSAPTIAEHNLIENANSAPAIYSTVSSYTFGLNQLAKSSAGVQFSGSNFILRYNTLTNNVSSTGTVEFGARWYNVSGSTYIPVVSNNNQVYGNTFYNNKGPGQVGFIDLWSTADKTAGRIQQTNTGNKIENNIFWNNSGSADSMFSNASVYGSVVYHYCCDASATNIPPSGWGGNTISHNIFDNSTYACISDVNTGTISRRSWTLAQCLSGAAQDVSSGQITDPLFANAAGGNFNLNKGSPAIDTGMAIAGQSFNGSAPDLGAFESSLTNTKAADLNNDGRVDVVDLSILLSNFGTNNSVADINGDGTVSVLDLSVLLSNFGT